MTSLQQRAELQRQIWAIANDVRGSVDGWDFKQFLTLICRWSTFMSKAVWKPAHS